MEHVHGVDVSWMTHGSPRDKTVRTPQRRNTLPPSSPRDETSPSAQTTALPTPSTPNGHAENSASGTPVAGTRPGLGRSGSSEKIANGATPGSGTSPQRRGSWFSNISSKFSGSGGGQSPPQANNTPPKQAEISVPRANPAKNAVLQHAAKYEGDGPYTPAPPRSTQAGILQVLRRLSSSSGASMSPSGLKGNHGLVERKVLNVDRNRERCTLTELNQSKLRRVAFCVDVEIAPMPKYAEPESLIKKACDKTIKRKAAERGEGDALKNPKPPTEGGRENGERPRSSEGQTQKSVDTSAKEGNNSVEKLGQENGDSNSAKGGDASKKKEKKKKSEEDRKARKEKKRKLAEVNGTIPMELHLDSDSSGSVTPTQENGSPRTQTVPTTNPVRIYRRCCQLRETPILKKITEQLTNPANISSDTGVVEKLDLATYWLQLPDLVTLGDYLAVVPIREVILENCGLNDEGLRVILAGLLAAKRPQRRARRTQTQHGGEPDGLELHGGFVERLVLRNNRIGPEGWKHLCLFIYMCRSVKFLDISGLPLPRTITPPAGLGHHHSIHRIHSDSSEVSVRAPISICQLLSKSLANRLAGPRLELLNLGETNPEPEHLGLLMDGIIKCGIKKLSLAHDGIDSTGVGHVARYMASGMCEGLDLGGNDLREQLEILVKSLPDDSSLVALSLAECNLKPGNLCVLFPKLIKLKEFRFIDLSHNQDLFKSSPSSISILRRYLPKMECLKRIHLTDVAMSSEQAIALAEILPEVIGLAHVSLLENPELAKLADAKTEESQEEACALYASLLAATRVSPSIVLVDIDVPTEGSGEIVKAMAKQVVAYCLRNMENVPIGNAAGGSILEGTAGAGAGGGAAGGLKDPDYPDVLQHLVGHDVTRPESPELTDAAPDDDYVIGGTGVVKALACCLKNRGDDSRRPSGEFLREGAENSPISPSTPSSATANSNRLAAHGKAKDMSKHLLGSARKIRQRLQPAMAKAKDATSTGAEQDLHAYHRLLFLDRTLDGIIKRFEDEFPETREQAAAAAAAAAASASDATSIHSSASSTTHQTTVPSLQAATSFGSESEFLPGGAGAVSDGEEDTDINRPALSRSNSMISLTSKSFTDEEGRILRAGHKFRSGWIVTQQHYDLLSSIEQIEADPLHVRVLHEMLEELHDEALDREAAEVGILNVFRDRKEYIAQRLRGQDPEHWERFVESQRMARANVNPVGEDGGGGCGGGKGGGADEEDAGGISPRVSRAEAAAADEVAVAD